MTELINEIPPNPIPDTARPTKTISSDAALAHKVMPIEYDAHDTIATRFRPNTSEQAAHKGVTAVIAIWVVAPINKDNDVRP